MATPRLGVTPRQGIVALAGGLVGAAAFWPLTLWPLIFVSGAIFARLLRDLGTQQARNVGLVYGIAFASGTMYWMFNIFGLLAIPLLAILAAYFGLLATLFAMTRPLPTPARVFLFAVFAVGIEWLRGDAWYLRFPWYSPPHALAASPPMIAGARWLGAYGLSFTVWLVAAAGAFRPAAYLAILALPSLWLFLPPDGAPDRRVLLLQKENGGVESIIAALPKEPVDLAVLPELAYTCSPEAALKVHNGPIALARKTDAPVVFGAVMGDYGQMPFENIAAVITAGGRLVGTFTKQRPVPLMQDGTPGTDLPVFPVEEGVLGVAICYDFDAPAVAGRLTIAGATVLVSPTLDLKTWGRVQHEHHALLFRLRAVENDRWLVGPHRPGERRPSAPAACHRSRESISANPAT
jgi:apolipoprotein N-acyltransferase